jgi:hypothetical protein
MGQVKVPELAERNRDSISKIIDTQSIISSQRAVKAMSGKVFI